MGRRYAELLAEWRHLDQAAREGEQTLKDRWRAYFCHAGPGPTREQREAVETLREQARRKFGELMRYSSHGP